MERILFTLDDLLLRAELLMLGSTAKALRQPLPEKGHRLQRTKKHEATCTCGLWSCRTDEEDETAIAATLERNHREHVRRETETPNNPKEKRS
jgi:hypothetical protein